MYYKDVLPYFAGIPTFLRSKHCEINELKGEKGDIVIVGIPHDTTKGSRPGTRFGPKAIRESSIIYDYFIRSGNNELVDIESEKSYFFKLNRIWDVGDLNVYPANVLKTSESIEDGIFELTSKDFFPVILGGDHFITYPAFKGFTKALTKNTKKKFGYIHVDAHLDCSDDHPVLGPLSNTTLVRRIAELDVIDTKNIAMIGIQGMTDWEQLGFIKGNGISIFNVESIRKKGVENVAREAAKIAIEGCDLIYLSIDIDVVDAACSPGTGFVNLDGITSKELLNIVKILRKYPIGAIDIVEVAPNFDPSGVTSALAAACVFEFILKKISEDRVE